MKKLYFTFLTILSGLTVSIAQTLTATNHNPVLGEVYKTTDASTVGVTPGGTGSGQTWNFSSVTIGTINTTYSVVTAAATLSASLYPSSNVATSTGTFNSFYSTSTNDYKYWGGNLTIGAFNIVLNYGSPALYAKYPMSLNSSTTAAVSGSISASGNNGTFTGNSSVVADGTGTLVLPGRTFNSVIRVANTQTLNFTLIVPGTVTQIVYEYYDPTKSKIPLFTINSSTITSALGTSTQVAVSVNADYLQVGIKEQTKEVADLNIFPNPAKSNFNIRLTNENADAVSYEIINAIGQTVRVENLASLKGESQYSIDSNNLESGIYFVKVKVGEAISVKKITIQ